MSSIVVYTHRLLVKHLFKLTNQDLISKLNDLSTSIRNFIRYLEIIKLLIVLCYGFFTFKTGISPIEASYEYVCVCVCVNE